MQADSVIHFIVRTCIANWLVENFFIYEHLLRVSVKMARNNIINTVSTVCISSRTLKVTELNVG